MEYDVKLFDLKKQYISHRDEYQKIFDEVCMDSAFCDGKYVHEFEKEFSAFTDTKHASAVNSGTSAVFLALKALGIKEGDEVIVPSMTFVASAWGAVYCGATPVFADSKPDTWEVDPKSVESKITDKTKAIVGVHLYGVPFDFDKVKKIADKHNIPIVEDCAQAHGARYNGKSVGSLGAMGCFSFYPTKNLGAFGEGGCVVSNNAEYIEKINSLKKHSADENGLHIELGYNMRMEGIQAAILSKKLEFVADSNKRRQAIANRYNNEIKNPKIQKQVIDNNCEAVYHIYSVCVPGRAEFIEHMKNKGIECGIHYKKPCHLQKAFEKYGCNKESLPISEYVFSHCVSIPVYPELTDEEVEKVIKACNEF